MGSDWTDFPKIELHLHLEGAAPPDLTREVATENGASLDGAFDSSGAYAWRDFTEFLALYDRVAAIYASPEASARLAETVCRRAAAQGVIYLEIFLSPDHVSPGDGADRAAWAEHLASVSEGVARAQAETGIVARFIPLCVRGFGPERARRAAEIVTQTPHPNVVGWGMAGDERVCRPADFAPAFRIAGEAGLGLTAHAGEFEGPDSVRAALDDLGVSRLGHGVRAIEDPALVARLADERVTLEVNPGSNIALGVYPDWPSHPLPKLLKAGVPVTISTDDPPFFATDMVHEFAMAEQAFGFDKPEFRAITQAALDAAFCDAETKAALQARLDA